MLPLVADIDIVDTREMLEKRPARSRDREFNERIDRTRVLGAGARAAQKR